MPQRRYWPAAPPLTSERLLLEPLRVEHAAEMVRVLDDPAMYRFTGGEPPSETELKERYRGQAAGASPDGREGWLNWVLRVLSRGEAVGTIQATLRGHVTELAWVVSSCFQGRGYATEGATAALEWLQSIGFTLFEAHIHPDHEASAGVALRLGFEPTDDRRDGEVRWVLAPRCHN